MKRIRNGLLPIRHKENPESIEAQIEIYHEELSNLTSIWAQLDEKYFSALPKVGFTASPKVDWEQLIELWDQYGTYIRRLRSIDAEITSLNQIIYDSDLDEEYWENISNLRSSIVSLIR